MNPTTAVLINHRTVRKYLPDPVDDRVLDEILEAGIRASTTGNMQVYSIIVTKETERKKALWEYHFKQDMVLEAPVLLTFLADFNRFNKWCEYRDASPGYDNFLSFFTASIDALLVAQNVAVAAESYGLGICYLGTTTYNAGKLVSFFNCPPGVVPVTTLVVGYPAGEAARADRLPARAVIHSETYRQYERPAIDDLYREKENLPETAALLAENQLPNLASIFTQKRYTASDNRHFSMEFLKVIQEQGFMNQ